MPRKHDAYSDTLPLADPVCSRDGAGAITWRWRVATAFLATFVTVAVANLAATALLLALLPFVDKAWAFAIAVVLRFASPIAGLVLLYYWLLQRAKVPLARSLQSCTVAAMAALLAFAASRVIPSVSFGLAVPSRDLWTWAPPILIVAFVGAVMVLQALVWLDWLRGADPEQDRSAEGALLWWTSAAMTFLVPGPKLRLTPPSENRFDWFQGQIGSHEWFLTWPVFSPLYAAACAFYLLLAALCGYIAYKCGSGEFRQSLRRYFGWILTMLSFC